MSSKFTLVQRHKEARWKIHSNLRFQQTHFDPGNAVVLDYVQIYICGRFRELFRILGNSDLWTKRISDRFLLIIFFTIEQVTLRDFDECCRMMINKTCIILHLDSFQQINAAVAPSFFKPKLSSQRLSKLSNCPHRDYLCDVNNSRRESSEYEEAAEHNVMSHQTNPLIIWSVEL